MTTEHLLQQISRKKSFLCIGLDTDVDKIPPSLRDEADPIFSFNRAIIDATHRYCVAYKANTAFYEAYGPAGWEALGKTAEYLDRHYPEIFTIADAKRGDIGTTAERYARAFFEDMNFDAVTVSPYMGSDSVEPFLRYPGKHTILLALTSNPGAEDFQTKKIEGKELYKWVLETSKTYRNAENLMYVVGADKARQMQEVRNIIPGSFLLVPGIGAQGGSLQEVCAYGMTANVGLLVNASRSIIYASREDNFAQAAAEAAKQLQVEMAKALEKSAQG